MKRIYLLRHAKSSWDDPGLADHDRPLAPRGRRAVTALARHLRAGTVRPDLVLCSSALRARQTLEGMGEAIGAADVRVEDDLYAADTDALLERLRCVPPAIGSVMLIAHNPGLQDLAVDLAGSGPDLDRLRVKFPTGGLATIDVDGFWDEIAPGVGRLVSLVAPRDLR